MPDEKTNNFKVQSCTEGMDVDAAGISVKVGVHYPGRSVYCNVLLSSRGDGMDRQKSAEGIAGLLNRQRPEPVNSLLYQK